MFPILQVGPLAIQTPGLVLLLGLWLGLTYAERHAPRYGLNSNLLYNLVFVALVAGVLGARLSYVVRYPYAFAESPLSLFSLNPGLLDAWGGAVTGILAGIIYAQRKGLALWPTLDAITPLLAVLGIAAGLSHLASGAAFGAPTRLPWGIELWGMRRHPTQVYETLAAFLIWLAVWPGREAIRWFWSSARDRRDAYTAGGAFLSFIALSAAARLFLEGLRGDSTLMPGGLRSTQVIAWLVLAAGLWGLERLRRRSLSNQVDHQLVSQE